ncbi:hypothetical protein [Candidatus Protochlamydia amoebophila]|uniref:hypothetical protein n=1 Tax=Candidatus Protochlamydia amoebophila TaxID=362787 RepID=UPI001BC9C00E|nr:hypothetical protein [Candidatus Protochlamydia amoebophila]
MIKIAERLRPFSHQSGTLCLIPMSSFAVQVFPCLIRLFRWDLPTPQLVNEYHIFLKGPVEDFTIQTDLEKGKILVWGKTAFGPIRYIITSTSTGISLMLDRSSEQGIVFKNQNKEQYVLKGKSMYLIEMMQRLEHPSLERLSLGNHKRQDWDLIKRRLDLTEIFPIWYSLGQWIPTSLGINKPLEEMGCHFRKIEEIISQNQSDQAVPIWKQIFQATFQGILVPFWKDEFFQGVIDQTISPVCSPLALLKKGMHLMQRHFIQQEFNHIYLLPVLPPEFHCGRLLSIKLAEQGLLNMEWTKKVIRQVSFYSAQQQDLHLHFRHVKKCRIKKQGQKETEWITSGECFNFEKNCYYIFDNFK